MSRSELAKKPKIDTAFLKGQIGSSDFTILAKSKYFVDKTLMLKTICELESNFILVTAPRRFGKSTNLSMVRRFFELPHDEINRSLEERNCYELFQNLKIGGIDCKEIRDNFMGKYPVIMIDFRCNTPVLSYYEAVEKCKTAVHTAYKEHAYLINSSQLDSDSKELCRRWINRVEYKKFEGAEIEEHIIRLSEYLFQHFGKKCFVLVDEYDSICSHAVFTIPSQDLNRVISFVMGILNALIKGNEYVERAFLTGISQICSLGMSGSNVVRYKFLHSEEFVNFYGFIKEEFDELLHINGISKDDELYQRAVNEYNGYNFKKAIIFNTWAVVNFLGKGKIESFWCDSGLVMGLGNIFRIELIKCNLENLLSENGTIDFVYNTTTSCGDLLNLKSICSFDEYQSSNIGIFFTFLFENGYLSPVDDRDEILKVKLPNKEIKGQIYQKLQSYVLSYGQLDFNLIQTCAKHFDDIFLQLACDNIIGCKECLSRIYKCLQNIFSLVPSKKFNESYLHSILLIIAWQTSGKFLSKTKCSIECNAYELDIAVYNGTSCIIQEAKYNKSIEIAMKQIFDRQYFTIFQFKEYFPNEVKNFILLGINVDKEKKVSMNAVFNSKYKTTVPEIIN